MVNMMNKLDDLIQELCPQGVCYMGIGTAVNYEQPTKYIVSSTKYDDTYKTPVLTAGQTFILGYTDETQGIYPASKENPVIIFDDFTGAFKWVDFPFKVKSSAMKILTANEEKAMLRYVYHFMGALNFTSDEHKRLWINTYSKFEMPLPPMPVQREIVKMLDDFTELTTELTKRLTEELTARKKQYEYYRNTLLTFSVHRGGTFKTEWRTLGKICDLSAGGDVPKDKFSKEKTEEFKVPIFSNGVGNNALYGYTDKAKIKAPCVTIAARGTIGYCALHKEDFYPIIRLICAKPKDCVLAGYLKYYVETLHFQVPTSGIPQLTVPMVAKYKIPVPDIEIQQKIVDVLDNFDAICSDLNSGLPAEIEARQKQYEYYRDRLLTF